MQYLPGHRQALGRVQPTHQVRAHARASSHRHKVWQSTGSSMVWQMLDGLSYKGC